MRIKKLLLPLAIILILLAACAAPGTSPAPAEIEVMSLNIMPPEVTAGETVSITAEVRNTGISQGTYIAILNVDGADVETKEVVVASGATEKVTFSLVKDKAGSYQVGIGGMLVSSLINRFNHLTAFARICSTDFVHTKGLALSFQ